MLCALGLVVVGVQSDPIRLGILSVMFADAGVCTNQAESFFSRLRRSELGVPHHFSPQYLHQYSGEVAWREDHRRVSNAEQYVTVSKLALGAPG